MAIVIAKGIVGAKVDPHVNTNPRGKRTPSSLTLNAAVKAKSSTVLNRK